LTSTHAFSWSLASTRLLLISWPPEGRTMQSRSRPMCSSGRLDAPVSVDRDPAPERRLHVGHSQLCRRSCVPWKVPRLFSSSVAGAHLSPRDMPLDLHGLPSRSPRPSSEMSRHWQHMVRCGGRSKNSAYGLRGRSISSTWLGSSLRFNVFRGD
jgi:hypothetical protein